jgi:hypothetical protein
LASAALSDFKAGVESAGCTVGAFWATRGEVAIGDVKESTITNINRKADANLDANIAGTPSEENW